METNNSTQRNTTSSAHGVLGFVFTMLACGALEQVAAFLDHLLCGLAGQLLQALPCLLLASWRLLGSQTLDLERFWACYRMLASLAPLVHCMFALALR